MYTNSYTRMAASIAAARRRRLIMEAASKAVPEPWNEHFHSTCTKGALYDAYFNR